MWLSFFKTRGHHFLPPASLIPVNDPSLLWINSGVATLKPYFDGRLAPPAPRLTNSQKAIRTNDIENVGVTARHQTMFEMLGNFSIGDYFKEDALKMAWELLTSPQWFAIDPNKLYITVFNEDEETYRLWRDKIGVSPTHLFKMGKKTNFWEVGPGPAGPNTEIFFDRGVKWDPQGSGTKLIKNDIENDRYVEIWNIVFSQFNSDGKGHYRELPRKNIDTGAGLERLASISQQTPTNFETDLFLPVIKQLETITKPTIHYSLENYFQPSAQQTKINTAFKVIADHVRAVSFAIAEGILPSNKDRGYIVRRLIRRAQLYAFELGINQTFLSQLVDNSIAPMAEFYPELSNHRDLIKNTIHQEEIKFLKTLTKGYKHLNQIISTEKELSAKNIWLLFESFGFPIELTTEIAQRQQIPIDFEAVKALRQQARARSREARNSSGGAWNKQSDFYSQIDTPSQFTGWSETVHKQAKVSFIFQNETAVKQLENESGFIILDQTPFYAEKGGQAADQGFIHGPSGTARVLDVQLGPKNQPIHQVVVQGLIKIGDLVNASVNADKRRLTQKNHSATHLLHSALRAVLGKEVMQSGSYNDEKGLRLDFSFHRPLTPTEISKIQALVNHHIQQNHHGEIIFCPLDEAINKHQALAFFGDKYDKSQVRVVKFADFSAELCGGTHVGHTQEIETFLITEVLSKGKGTLRVKAITSEATVNKFLHQKWEEAQNLIAPMRDTYSHHTQSLKAPALEAGFKMIQQFKINSQNWTELAKLLKNTQLLYSDFLQKLEQWKRTQKLKQFSHLTPKLQANGVNKIEFFTHDLELRDLKELADKLRSQYDDLVVILGSQTAKTGFLVVAISPTLTARYSALEIFRTLPGYQTTGGGNRTFAQGKYELIQEPKKARN